MLRPLLSLLLVIAALVAHVPTGAAFASTRQTEPSPGLGIRLLEAPEARRDDPRARDYVVDHVDPGTTFRRRFEVSNGTDQPMTVDLYSSAATVENGAFVPAAGRGGNDLSEWISVEPRQLTVPPRGRLPATATFAVPNDAQEGERYAAIFAERPAPAGTDATISVASRVGIRVYLSVGPGGEPPTDFELVSFAPKRAADGSPAVEIESCNRGGRAVDLTGELELTEGPGGTRAGPFTTTGATTVAPGECQTVDIPLDEDLPRGPWKATVTLRSGPNEKKATATITFPQQAGETAAPVEADEVTGTDRGRVALSIALLLLLLVLLALAWLLWRKKRREKKDATDGDAG